MGINRPTITIDDGSIPEEESPGEIKEIRILSWDDPEAKPEYSLFRSDECGRKTFNI